MTHSIPKIAHFVWGNPSGIPLSRLLSIITFAHHNPLFQIKVHLFDSTFSKADAGFRGGELSGVHFETDYSHILQKLANIKLVNHRCRDYQLDPGYPPAFMSDRIRYHILHLEGGFYFDTDVVFFAPLENSYLFSPLHSHINCIVSASHLFHGRHLAHRIGFLASAKGCRLMERIFQITFTNFDLSEYQSCGAASVQMALGGTIQKGSRLLNSEAFPEVYVHNVLDSLYYRYNCASMSAVLTPEVFDMLTRPNPWFNGVHWYGGAFAGQIDTTSIDDLNNEYSRPSEKKFVEHVLAYAVNKASDSLGRD